MPYEQIAALPLPIALAMLSVDDRPGTNPDTKPATAAPAAKSSDEGFSQVAQYRKSQLSTQPAEGWHPVE